jgi:DNA polymerase-4
MVPSDISASPLRWLYVDFNSYFASVEQQLNPALRRKPVAVVAVETDSTCAIAASYEAKAFGVRTGTPIYEAKRLCPGLICVPARHEHYVEYHHRLCEEIGNHLPVSRVCSIDEMACYLMDNENSPEAASRIARSIKAGIRARVGEHIRCSVGIAPNAYLAKVATELQKPDGLVALEAAQLPGPLLRLNLRDLPGIGHSMEARLYRAGIRDMPALWRLAPRQMRSLWHSVWGERLWYLLRGFECAREETQRSSVGHSHVLAPELRPAREARYVARRLMLKAASRLRRIGCRAARVSLAVRIEHGARWHEEARCAPACDNAMFLQLLEALWARMLRECAGARLKKVSVVLSDLVTAENGQGELFAQLPTPEKTAQLRAERLSRAMDAINGRYGRDTVSLGLLPRQGRSFSGVKIAFTRIPDREEFQE